MQLKKTICTDAKFGLICVTNDVMKALLGEGFTNRAHHGHWLTSGQLLFVIMHILWDCLACKPSYTNPEAPSLQNLFSVL